MTGVDENPVSGEAGRFRGHACGRWAVVDPLPPGKHTVEVRGRGPSFEVDVDYVLTVVGL
ncbi:hypothetical protein ACFQV2_10930 [Actinokineospora soli]|uniref:Uncharacterized protein n=1 Tax=Actinokineospora soli TaxID=1048753 RepID=A0ABW2TKQ1_9PSEU